MNHGIPIDLVRCRSMAQAALLTAVMTFAIGFANPALTFADSGYATWYGPGFQGNVMANGQIYDMYDPTTTACNIYPMGTWLKVTNPANGRSVVVQVRDRGAFSHALDLSYAAFKAIGDPVAMEIPVTYVVVTGGSGTTVVAAPRAAPASRGGRPAPATSYVVQPGDTFSGIAAQLSIDQGLLASWNAISDPNVLTPGTTLRLTAPPIAPAVTAPSVASSTTAPPGTYTVQPGDTLLALAVQFGVPSENLAAANGLSDPFVLVAGQSLVVPSGPNGTLTYAVQSGDTLTGIASTFNISSDSLAVANQITDPTLLQPGTVLTIPSH